MSIASKRFEILRRLGEGGMGVVHEALDRETGGRVALKTLRSFSADALARFKHEFRSIQDLHHPNLIALGELVSEGDEWFFSMELVEGCDFLEYVQGAGRVFRETDAPVSDTHASGLEEIGEALATATAVVRRRSSRPPPRPVWYDETRLRSALRQLADGLGAMHAAGLVHRDIKPSNIRVTPEERLVLLDFGLVSEVGVERTAVRIEGTPAYMAPEQATGGEVGPQADWYSVGVLLYEALTGTVPFEGAALDVLMRKQRMQPAPPRARATNVPADLDELCVALLQFDPGARPAAREIVYALGGVPSVSTRSTHSRTLDSPFVGRGRELEVLRTAFDDARGTAVSAVVSGESGVGKTALVRHFLDVLRLEEPQLVTLTGRCYERETVPYKAFDGVIDSLTRIMMRLPEAERAALVPTRVGPLVQVFPVLQRVKEIAALEREPARAMDPLELRSRAFAGVREVLTRLADRRPLVVVIDDVQWSDEDSRMLLNDVLRPPDAPNLLLIATMRGHEAAGGDTDRQVPSTFLGSARRVEMSRLSSDESRTLATLLLERADRANEVDALSIAREAEGNPLFIDALVRHTATTSKPGQRASGLEDALWSQIEPLDVLARRIVELLAVAAAPIPQEVLAHASETDGLDLTKRIALLRVAHLVQTAGPRGTDAIDVFHDRVRVAVLARLDAGARRERHRRLAVAFKMAGEAENAEALATHLGAAGDKDQAARYAEVAADQAVHAIAFQRAARLYEIALTRGDLVPAEHRKLQEKLGSALANAGRGALAARAFKIAAEGAPAADALDLHRRAAEQLLRAGHFDEGVSAIRTVLASIGMSLPATPFIALVLFVLGRLYLRVRGLDFRERESSHMTPQELVRIDICWSAVAGLALVDTIRGGAFQNRHLVLALRAGEPFRVVRALGAEIGYVSRGGGATWRQTEMLMARTRALAERTRQPEAVGFANVMSGMAHYLAGKFRRGLELYDRGHEVLRDETSGTSWEIATAQWGQLNCLAWMGELKELGRRRPLYVQEATDRGDLYGLVNLRVGISNIALLAADDPDQARADVVDAMRRWSKQGFHIEHYLALVARVNADLYSGRPLEAHAIVTEQWPAFRRSLLLTIQALRIAAPWSRARCAIAAAEAGAGDVAGVVRLAERDARAIEREQWGWSAPLAALLRAGVAMVGGGRGGDPGTAQRLLAEAAAGFDAQAMALHAAAARRALGRLLGRAEGRELVERADEWMRSETVKNPARLAAMLAPGFAKVE